uniref:Polyprotein n=5 Tax=Tymovirales TaxID=675063 RepID=A0A2R2WVR5_9VIRU|nr:polyprotein [Peach virus T]
MFKNIIDSLSSTAHRDTVSSPLVEAVSQPLRDSLTSYPYAVPSTALQFLASCGISVSGFGHKAHPHPVHKTIETHLIHDVWPHYATTQASMMFMKPSKFLKIQRQCPNLVQLHNYRVTAKDATRYPETSPDLPNTPTVFMHDALMYYTPAQVLDLFTKSQNLQRLYASVVIPPESSFTDLSLSPSLYQIQFEDDTLVYQLEGNPAHAYRQPRSALQWLSTTTIRGPDFDLTISILDSWGPVHSLLIQRGRPHMHEDEDTVYFKVPKSVALPEPASLRQDLRHRLVPAEVHDALFVYTRAVRTLRVTDPAGFVRTQCSKPEYSWVTSAAWDNLQHFALQTAPHRPHTTFYIFPSIYAKLKHWLRAHTKALQLSGIAAASACASLSAYLAARLASCSIASLSIFGRWVRPPPTASFALSRAIGLPQKAPSFSLSLCRKPLPPFGMKLLLKPLTHHRWLRPLYADAPIPRFWIKASLAAVSTAAIAAALRHFLGPDTPQHMHDKYMALFHPQPWQLKIRRGVIRTNPSPFLPFQPTPAIAPSDSSDEEDDSRFRPSLAPVPSPATAPSSAQASSQAEPATAAQAEPALPIQISSAPAETPQAVEELKRSLRANQADGHQPEPAPEGPSSPKPLPDSALLPPSGSEPILEPSQPDSAGPTTTPPVVSSSSPPPGFTTSVSPSNAAVPHTDPPPHSSLLYGESQISVQRDGHVVGLHTTPEPIPDEISALLKDPTAAGPVLQFHQLHPGAYLEATAAFPARARNGLPATFPYPRNDCLLRTIHAATHIPLAALWECLCVQLPDSVIDYPLIERRGLSTLHFSVLARFFSLRATFLTPGWKQPLGMEDATQTFTVLHTPPTATTIGHFELVADGSEAPPAQLAGAGAKDLALIALSFRTGGHLLPIAHVHNYTTAPSRAKNLISNMKNGFDGVLANIDPHRTHEARDRLLSLDGIMDLAPPKQVALIHIAGFAGCGKSYPIQKLLTHPAFAQHKIALPTVELRNEWKAAMKPRPAQVWRISTWESSLLKSARVLVIDEVYKLPRGYVDLAIHADPSVEFVILLGDPLQGEYHSTHPDSSNHRLSSELKHLRPYLDYYCLWSRRIPKLIADFFQIPTLSEAPGYVRYMRSFSASAKLLANSIPTAKTLQQVGFNAITISSSQGSTLDGPAFIHLDRHSNLLSHHHSLVALTRSRAGVVFTGDRSLLSGLSSSNLIFSALAANKPVSLLALFPSEFYGLPTITAPLTNRRLVLSGGDPYAHRLPIRGPTDPGPSPSTRDDVLLTQEAIVSGNGELALQRVDTTFLPETRRPLHQDVPSAMPEPAQPSPIKFSDTAFEPVYPGEDFYALAAHFQPANDPETREILFRDQMSCQFPFLDEPFEISCQPMSLLAARHREKKDPTLLPASIPKRLRFRPSNAPYQITPKDEILGGLLFNSLCRAYRRNPNDTVPFDEALFAECIALNEFAQLTSKTQATIMANANRSDPDWRYSAVRIFAKTQHKVNDASIFGSWKACQTLALMHDAVVLLLGPVKKYQRVFDQEDRPSHIYVHASHTPFEMSEWCQANLTDAVHLANDYTAFDQSQHGEAVVLERKKMERLSIPEHLIELHVHLKTNVSTQFGPLTCMRLTGEPGTYDDNTDYNIAVIYSEYACDSVPLMVSGDDSLLDFEPPTLPNWAAIRPLLALTFKKERSLYPTFCGFNVGRAGALRAPKTLFAKIAIAIDDGSIDEKLASYLTEFSVGHSLGDQLWQLLPIDAVPYQSACFDFFCRHATPAQKLVLKIGEIPMELLEAAFEDAPWASHAVWALLRGANKSKIIAARKSRPMPESSDVSMHQGRLPSAFQGFQTHPLMTLSGAQSPANIALLDASAVPDLEPMSNAQAPQVGPRPDSDVRVDRQLPLPAPHPGPPPPLPSKNPDVIVPFQWVISDFDGADLVHSTIDLSASTTLKKVTAYFRYASIQSVEALIIADAAAISKPIPVSLVWTINSLTPDSGKELDYFGGQRIVAGGPVSLATRNVIPADLTRLTPIIKDRVTYSDTPRLTWTAQKVAGAAKGTTLCSLVIVGTVLLSAPTGTSI